MGRSPSPSSSKRSKKEKHRSEKRRKRSRDRSRERRKRRRSYDSDRDRGGSRDRSKTRRTRSRSPYEKESRSGRRSPPSRSSKPTKSAFVDPAVASGSTTAEEEEMRRTMGFTGFSTTKGKKVEGNDVGDVHVILKRKYRQYMNRKGGFNRPLDFVA